MKTIAIIPARGGSKRLLNKNILKLGAIPLLVHSILYAKANSKIIDAIYVSTNDEGIKKIAQEYGVQVIDRPEYLSGEFEPTLTALQHALEVIEDSTVENVILLQPTNPLRPENLLQEAFERYRMTDSDSLFTVTRNHQKLGKIASNCFEPYNYIIGQRSQDLEPLYFENGLLYISKSRLIREGKIISENSIPYVVNHIFASIDIDTQDDFDYAEYLYQKLIT
ncbi:acylneuraminate cytidylyltransferase family protein [Flavobacterium gawalongense]|uniref:Acylneuraminate cytidylyltransferase family protein n=1 Tax=Flavobacterium gawalongense TaxID=2594432 RepID=A0A553BZ27_9FLAO|nr:acylneuraminate cytidylyltransferase family protein [Flavobacterium gawalongense]TRX13484.1 acylneuraminate cytidylyltransferase family protein [Flavobacterium gawalongense]TRX15584.1 acylneuraminate cytidylyltransferase family protein [Flavobacterium gawalongense]TRX31422.1 acylneuraminate cytidylyltransferase family protein [Flavobacterium gawalongense]